MLTNVVKKHIFSNEEMDTLRNMFDGVQGVPDNRWQNITNIFKTDLESHKKFVDHFVGKLIRHSRDLTGTDWKMHLCFFLEYHPGGEAKMHVDAHAKHNKGISTITLVNQENLEGGTIIVADDSNKIVDVHQEVGETVFYNADIPHGVTKVTQGYRQVLVTWLVPKE